MSTDDGGAPSEEEVMRTVVEGPYRALAGPAARLFRLLDLHPGPDFGLHSAAVVADLTTGKARQLLDDLVGANLLEQTAPDRYQFHDLLRAHATDQAHAEETPEDREAALRRLLTWYLHTADAAQDWISPGEDNLRLPPATGPVSPLTFADYDAAVDWAERELPIYRRVVAAATASGDDRLTWQLAETLWHAWPPSSARAEWTGIGQAGVEAAVRDQDPAVQLRLLTRLGMAYRERARHDEGLECLGRALHLARAMGRRFDEARVRNAMGLIHLRRRELDLASGHFDDAGAILRDLGDQRLAGAVHANAATAHYRAGRLPEAAVALRHALDVYRSSDDPGGLGNVLRLRAELHLAEGRQDEALADASQAMDIALALRDRTREAYWLLTLGDVQRHVGVRRRPRLVPALGDAPPQTRRPQPGGPRVARHGPDVRGHRARGGGGRLPTAGGRRPPHPRGRVGGGHRPRPPRPGRPPGRRRAPGPRPGAE
ncbi:tetratricopeptide repeat protein [Streptomyces sp. NRRL F-5123]|uniref:tetratricopeptide repeat protein n=1 Tax=Streptomyces sp. NRRL F-5123 TaxID=1463856 RepID=UPI00131B8844|nr:tetratricopeptide repeat protein [Streptomyces sp. NRRL F-5123]